MGRKSRSRSRSPTRRDRRSRSRSRDRRDRRDRDRIDFQRRERQERDDRRHHRHGKEHQDRHSGLRHNNQDRKESSKSRGDRSRDRQQEFGTGANREVPGGGAEKEEMQKPNLGLSGKLTEDTNMFNGVVIKYNEPPEAKKPKKRWRFYVFKGEESLPVMHLHRQSAYLIGKDRKVADIPVDHPSCSRQHAVLQYRAVERELSGGRRVNRVTPYIIDLESSNGTYVNNQRIDARRYVELREKDVVKFGFSSREYVMLHEQSQTDDDNDD